MNTQAVAAATSDLKVEPTPCTYSIGKRLSLLLALQTIIGLGVLLASIYAATHMLFTAKQDETLQAYSAVLADVLHESDAKGGEAEIVHKLQWLGERQPGTFVQVLRADGSELYRDASPTFDPSKAPSRERRFEIRRANGGAPLQGRLVLDCTRDAQHGQRIALLLVAATLGGGIFVAWATFWRVRCSLRPLMDLAAQTRAVDVRRLEQRLSLPEPIEELQPLIEQFNGLMQRVERTYVQLEGFNADVAHELRTPLANLIGHTEVALSRQRSVTELEDVLVSNLEELQRMAGIVNDMLFLAQADRGVKARRGAPVSLAELVRQVVEFHEAPMEDAGLGIDIVGDAQIAIDEPLCKRALSNLLGNAIRYAEKGSRLCVRIEPQGGSSNGVRLWVENVGPAIEPDHLPRLFDRFFRADASRCEMEKPHHGLGLSIVAAIARMHDGFAIAESQGGRTRVGFNLN